jgi:two-component system, NarL family, nitrate/nitrite response regulator NarL
MPMRMLLVEDQDLVRAGLRLLLQTAQPGCQVLEADTPQRAMAIVAAEAPELVFLDIDLRAPTSGLDLLTELREKGAPCRVIMLSSHDDRPTVLDCLARGASGYITKNLGDEGVMRQAIEHVLAGGVYLPASLLNPTRSPPSAAGLKSARPVATLGLSPRLCTVLYHVCQGLSNKQIARAMGISEGTVRKSYMSELLRFFGVTSRSALIVEVSRQQVILAQPST